MLQACRAVELLRKLTAPNPSLKHNEPEVICCVTLDLKLICLRVRGSIARRASISQRPLCEDEGHDCPCVLRMARTDDLLYGTQVVVNDIINAAGVAFTFTTKGGIGLSGMSGRGFVLRKVIVVEVCVKRSAH